MNVNNLQEIISSFNAEGITGSYTTTFLFLWSFGENEITIRQNDLADQIGLEKRTLRGHLYRMSELGMIETLQNFSSPNTITIKRFKHGS